MMHFGETVREILSASCGSDFRGARPSTALPATESAGALRTLAADLESAFGIEISEPDLAHLHTVRDVLQCVRLGLWRNRVAGRALTEATSEAAAPVARRFFATAARARFIRYARPATPPAPAIGSAPSRTA